MTILLRKAYANQAAVAGGAAGWTQAVDAAAAEAWGVDLRSLANWFDRYLAPHGLRTRCRPGAAGWLEVWVDCQRRPDGDRLVDFICHRLRVLSGAAIAAVRIVAHRAGSSEVFWEREVALEPGTVGLGVGASLAGQNQPPLASAQTVPETWDGRSVASPYRRRRSLPAPVRALGRNLAVALLLVREGALSWRARAKDPAGPTREQAELDRVQQWLQPISDEFALGLQVRRLAPTCLELVLTGTNLPADGRRARELEDRLVQSLCRRLWLLNARGVRGARIQALDATSGDLLWQQTVRLVSVRRPAWLRQSLRAATEWPDRLVRSQALAGVLADPVWQKTLRALVLGGATLVPFCLALWLTSSRPQSVTPIGTADSTPTRLEPTISLQPVMTPVARRLQTVRSPVVAAALEVVPVEAHPPANRDRAASLLFAGDVTLSDWVAERFADKWGEIFARLPELAQADLTMVNLEGPLTEAGDRRLGKRFNFKAPPAAVEALRAGGVDVVTLANNHTMDYNAPGLRDTQASLQRAKIHAVGAGETLTEARRPKIIEVKGQRIAYFGYYNAHYHAAGPAQAGTNPRDDAALLADIRAVRGQVEWVVVNFHWGEELARYPASYQTELGRRAIDAGADLVVGHHPHVLQGAEIYRNRAIVYSLGNFVFGGNARRDYDTALLRVAVRQRQMRLEFVPVEVRNYQPRVAKGDRGRAILRQISRLSSGFAQPLRAPMVLTVGDQAPATPAMAQAAPSSPASLGAIPAAEQPRPLGRPVALQPVPAGRSRPQPQAIAPFTPERPGTGHFSGPAARTDTALAAASLAASEQVEALEASVAYQPQPHAVGNRPDPFSREGFLAAPSGRQDGGEPADSHGATRNGAASNGAANPFAARTGQAWPAAAPLPDPALLQDKARSLDPQLPMLIYAAAQQVRAILP